LRIEANLDQKVWSSLGNPKIARVDTVTIPLAACDIAAIQSMFLLESLLLELGDILREVSACRSL
jgi:hypothetical protein